MACIYWFMAKEGHKNSDVRCVYMANAAMKNCLIGPHGPCDVTGPRHWPIADVVRESPSNVHIVSFTALVQWSVPAAADGDGAQHVPVLAGSWHHLQDKCPREDYKFYVNKQLVCGNE